MKKKFIIILLLLLFPFHVFAIEEHVVDEANLLSYETIDYINEYSVYLEDSIDISILTMTISSLQDSDIDQYADDVFQTYSLGDRGVLILFVQDKKALKILTGDEISNYLTSDSLNDIIHTYFVPFIKNAEYDKGISNGFSAIYQYFCDLYVIDAGGIEIDEGNDFITKYKTIVIVGLLVFSLFISYFLCVFFKRYFVTKKHSLFDYLVFGIAMFFNIALVCYVYTLDATSVFVYAAIVLYVVMRVFGDDNNVSLEEALSQAQEKEELKRKRKRK